MFGEGRSPGMSKLEDFFWELADITRFSGRIFREMFRKPSEKEEIARLCYLYGNRTIALIGITAFIIHEFHPINFIRSISSDEIYKKFEFF